MRTFVWLAEAFGLALTLVLLVTPLVTKSAVLLKLYDSPDGDRRVHDRPVPRVGGIAVFLVTAAIATILFIRTQPRFTVPGPVGVGEIRFLAGAFMGSGFLFLVGLVDDIRGLSPSVKFVAEIIAASAAWYFGARLGAIALGYGPGVSVGFLDFFLVVLWIVGVTNVFNFIDGLNGLAAGVAVVGCATIFAAGMALGNLSILLPTVALAGALLGFLRYNYPKASIFLGDSGSLSVGFLLAVFSIQSARNSYGAVLVIIPLVAVAVPLMDGGLAILRRWLRHVPISGADARHIHHRLLALGISPSSTAVLLWGLAAAMSAFGLLIALTAPFVATSFAILGVVGIAVMAIYGTNLLAYHELTVAGEVLASAPFRVRRVISDQIEAMDLVGRIRRAENADTLCDLVVEAASDFGFLAMQISGEALPQDRHTEVIHPLNWAWKLDYPIRTPADGDKHQLVLSIWCSQENSARPYGAERIARIVGPALQEWFVAREGPVVANPAVPTKKRRFPTRPPTASRRW
jgi:UDP-GlcNAc:undecaprenyl-phosphate GlcNAc-1-phosphate transferase